MQVKRVRNLTRGTTVAEKGVVADSFLTRLRGLIGHPPLKQGEGMLLTSSNSIHCMFMSFPIDVIYVNKQHQVVNIETAMKPWAVGRPVWGGSYVIELAAGAAAEAKLQVGDQLALE